MTTALSSDRHRDVRSADSERPGAQLPPDDCLTGHGFQIVSRDNGRVLINADFAALLTSAGLNTFADFMHRQDGTVAKHLIAERPTLRLMLPSAQGPVACYLKRHAPAKLKEYWKPLIRGRWPRLGAKPEWDAILRFHELGIPTMIPIACGCSGRQSFLLTLAVEERQKLSAWMQHALFPKDTMATRLKWSVIRAVADVTRRMHASGLHHQDWYAGHILLPNDLHPNLKMEDLTVLDLGRVRQCRHLRLMWIIKDLAQLHYSTSWFTRADKLRFLNRYLGRPLTPADRRLIRQIERKTSHIARHSRKHGLQ